MWRCLGAAYFSLWKEITALSTEEDDITSVEQVSWQVKQQTGALHLDGEASLKQLELCPPSFKTTESLVYIHAEQFMLLKHRFQFWLIKK